MFPAPLNRRFARSRTQWLAPAAIAASQGLPMIAKLLGHTQVQTTAHYAHFAADPVKAATEQVSSVIAKAIAVDTPLPPAVNE